MNPSLIWGVLALLIALIFAVFVPGRARVYATSGLQFVILRWFHSLVWLLLAVSFFLRSTQRPDLESLANPFAASAGVVYLLFSLTLSRLPKGNKRKR